MNARRRTVKLNDICDLDKAKNDGFSLPYVGLEHVESGTGKFVGSAEPTKVKSSTFKFDSRHVLYGRLRPYLNKVFLPNFEGHCSTEILPLKCSDSVDRHWLFYWLTWHRTVDAINATCTGARMPRANMKAVLEFELQLPELSEQKRIVAILDETFAGIETAIANTEKSLINARELFNSYLDQSANPREAEAIHVGDHFETVTGNTPPKKDPENWGSFMPLVKPPELRYGRISDAADSLSKKGAAKARVAPKDAVLVSCIGNLGKVGLAEVSLAFNQQINAIFPRADIMLPEFLFFQTLTTQFKRQLQRVASGTTVPIVNKSKFNELRLYAPPLNEQKRIVDQLWSISQDTQGLYRLMQQKLDALKELKQSLLQKAFSGELTADRAEREVASATV